MTLWSGVRQRGTKHRKEAKMSRKKESLVLQNLDGLNSNEAHLLVIALEKKAQTIFWDKDAHEVKSLIVKGLLESHGQRA